MLIFETVVKMTPWNNLVYKLENLHVFINYDAESKDVDHIF